MDVSKCEILLHYVRSHDFVYFVNIEPIRNKQQDDILRT